MSQSILARRGLGVSVRVLFVPLPIDDGENCAVMPVVFDVSAALPENPLTALKEVVVVTGTPCFVVRLLGEHDKPKDCTVIVTLFELAAE